MRVMESRSQRVLLFHRDYRGFTGGHLKVRDYYAHAEHATGFTPRIFFTHRSIQGPKNPWHGIAPPPLPSWRPSEAAALFVAGFDWQAVPDPSPAPVINLIQGVCHADDGDARRAFLSRRAVRICVSQEVADAICATGAVNGPVHVIPNGIDLGTISSNRVRDIGVFIAGLKNPTFAVALAALLVASGVRVDLSLNRIPRPEFLDRLSRANIVVALPCEREGFFLPALEAMAAGSIVVCPDCTGNREFCRDGITTFRPRYTLKAVTAATLAAVRQSPEDREGMRAEAAAEARRHSLDAERTAFLQILEGLSS